MGFSLSSVFGGGDSETTTKTQPWSGLAPYLKYGYQQAQNLYESGGPQYYGNATYVPFSPQTQMAMALGENRALMGSEFDQSAANVANSAMSGMSPYLGAGVNALGQAGLGMGQLYGTSQGAYLNGNPFLDQQFQAAVRGLNTQYGNNVLPGLNSTFGAGGRTGSMAHQTALDMANQTYGNNVADMAAQIYGGNYQAERDRQLAAANSIGALGSGLASGYGALGAQSYNQQMGGAALGQQLAQNDWANLDRLAAIGQQVQGQGQNVLNDYMNRFNYYQQLPEQSLMNFTNYINGLPAGNAGTSKQTGGGGGLLGNLQQGVDLISAGSALWDTVGPAVMKAAPVVASWFSDIALKENIQKIGERNGHNWYRWDWNDKAAKLGLTGSGQGVIAQEVEVTRPDLVTTLRGYKAVNYGGL